MPEAEVSLRLAFWLVAQRLIDSTIDVAIDGAQVQTGQIVHFDLAAFLERNKWTRCGDAPSWQCEWASPTETARIRIHSNPGIGDVVAGLKSGRRLRVECKKGPTVRSRSSAEYPLIREALGQLLTIEQIDDQDLLAVAVPHSPKFHELAKRWREAPLVKRFGIRILTIDQVGNVFGFD